MATELNRDVTRESTKTMKDAQGTDRRILVTLTENQAIRFRLKGLRSDLGEISLEAAAGLAKVTGALDGATDELGRPDPVQFQAVTGLKDLTSKKDVKTAVSILNHIRTNNAVTDWPDEYLGILDGILAEALADFKRYSF